MIAASQLAETTAKTRHHSSRWRDVSSCVTATKPEFLELGFKLKHDISYTNTTEPKET